MAKKIVKKKKLRVNRLILILIILGGLFFGVYEFLQLPIRNIVIKNTSYLNDDYIIEKALIKDYPSYLLTGNYVIKKRLTKSPYIKDVKVKKKWNFLVEIEVDENKPLFFHEYDKKIVFSDGTKMTDEYISYFRIPRLINYVPDDKFKSFIKGISKIKDDTITNISDIEYVPNDLDKDRFLLYMNDGNMVYLTLTKFNMINYYNDVLGQLEGRKGILYLDNGNHFQIKE